MRLRSSFQTLILFGCVVVVLGTLIFVAVFLQRTLRDQMIGQIRHSLLAQTRILNEVVTARWRPGRPVSETQALADRLGRLLNLRVTLIAPEGAVLGDSEMNPQAVSHMESHADRPEVVQALRQGQGWSLRRSTTLGVDLLYAAVVVGDLARPALVARVALPLAEVEKSLAQVRRLVVGAMVLGVLLSLGAAYLVARRISRPVKELTLTASRIAAGDLSRRVNRYPDHEMGELGRTFDLMADHLQAEIEAVTEAKDRLETILKGMVEGVLVLGRDGRIVLTNQALRRMLDLSDDPLNRTPAEILRSAEVQEAVQWVLAGEPHLSVEVRTIGPAPLVLEVHLVGLAGQDPRAGAVAVFHDITQRKRLEEVRRDFVANVSHELRTPLTAIRGAVETLLDGALSQPQNARRFAEVIARHAARLERIVEDLLDLTRLQSGAAAPLMEEIEIGALSDSVLGMVAELAAARRVELKADIPIEPISFRGDRRQIEQALVNLLDNALKYTEPDGRVVLGARKKSAEIHLAVSDTGVGMAKEHLERIFERFYRVDKNRSRDLGGTGLGLAIVKHIVQAHRGKITVESRLGRGSTFTLILPA